MKTFIASLALAGLLNAPAFCDEIDNALDNEGAAISTMTQESQAVSGDIDALNARLAMMNAGKCGLLVAGVQRGHAGSISVPISYIPGPTAIAILQADILDVPSATVMSVVAGPAADNAGKTVAFNKIPTAERFIVFGLNLNKIGQGVVATVNYDASAVAAGTHQIVLTNFVASDADGNSIPLCGTSGQMEVTP